MQKWGMDQPLHTRYIIYIKGVATGDLGVSFFSQEDVGKMLLPRIWPTLKLAVSALLIACLLGVPLGFYSALRQGSLADSFVMLGAVSGVSLPQFWLGLLLMFFFSVKMNLLPTFGYGEGALKKSYTSSSNAGRWLYGSSCQNNQGCRY